VNPAVELREVTRTYGEVRAADCVSMAVAPGEFFAMLGPSGSGKTTCLRLLAGFETPDAGQVLLDGRDVTNEPPYSRDVNTVFQDYALFPHMSVLENVCYGPRVRGAARAEQRRRALDMLELVQLVELADRRPAQLSGGQRQRVSLARALINQPRVLLLDEPLGALDLKLREEMQIELRNLQRRLGVTFIFVTHDQGEALSMANRVAVFNRGRIEQLDTPRELYMQPRTPFVARFVGSANVVAGELARRLTADADAFAIRAENVRVTRIDERVGEDSIACEGVVVDVQYHGATSRWQVRLDDGAVFAASLAEGDGRSSFDIGARVRLSFRRSDVIALTTDGE
jgi:putative spermidine/putrescine transport system ATP-binding protein